MIYDYDPFIYRYREHSPKNLFGCETKKIQIMRKNFICSEEIMAYYTLLFAAFDYLSVVTTYFVFSYVFLQPRTEKL